MPALLEAKGLHAAYGQTKVLHGIDFSVEEGGVKGFDGGSWNGVVMPAGTPQEMVNRIHTPIVAELRSAAV